MKDTLEYTKHLSDDVKIEFDETHVTIQDEKQDRVTITHDDLENAYHQLCKFCKAMDEVL